MKKFLLPALALTAMGNPAFAENKGLPQDVEVQVLTWNGQETAGRPFEPSTLTLDENGIYSFDDFCGTYAPLKFSLTPIDGYTDKFSVKIENAVYVSGDYSYLASWYGDSYLDMYFSPVGDWGLPEYVQQIYVNTDPQYTYAIEVVDDWGGNGDTISQVRLMWGGFNADNTATSYFCFEFSWYHKNTTTIDGVTSDSETPAEYFNLQGVRVDNPENGIFIRRQGNTTTKVRR